MTLSYMYLACMYVVHFCMSMYVPLCMYVSSYVYVDATFMCVY